MNVLVRNMEAGVCEKMVKLFNIAFFVVKEEIAFAKFPSLCALHIKNDVELGQTYLMIMLAVLLSTTLPG